MEGGRCKVRRRKINPSEIIEDLEGYELVKDVRKLRKMDRIKYLRKDGGGYKKGGLVLIVNKEGGYIVVQGFGRNWRTCKPITFSLQIEEVIIFRKK